jgi:hypothetical protein
VGRGSRPGEGRRSGGAAGGPSGACPSRFLMVQERKTKWGSSNGHDSASSVSNSRSTMSTCETCHAPFTSARGHKRHLEDSPRSCIQHFHVSTQIMMHVKSLRFFTSYIPQRSMIRLPYMEHPQSPARLSPHEVMLVLSLLCKYTNY